jgi:hypothetical protein
MLGFDGGFGVRCETGDRNRTQGHRGVGQPLRRPLSAHLRIQRIYRKAVGQGQRFGALQGRHQSQRHSGPRLPHEIQTLEDEAGTRAPEGVQADR